MTYLNVGGVVFSSLVSLSFFANSLSAALIQFYLSSLSDCVCCELYTANGFLLDF